MTSVKVGGKFEVYDKEKLEEIISRISKNWNYSSHYVIIT